MSAPLRFGKMVRMLREQAGLSQESLARKLGVSHGYVSQLERGYTHKGQGKLALPTQAMMRRMARALDVPAKTFVEWRLHQLDPRPPAKSGGGGVGFDRAAKNLIRLERADSELRAARAQLSAERAKGRSSQRSRSAPVARRGRKA